MDIEIECCKRKVLLYWIILIITKVILKIILYEVFGIWRVIAYHWKFCSFKQKKYDNSTVEFIFTQVKYRTLLQFWMSVRNKMKGKEEIKERENSALDCWRLRRISRYTKYKLMLSSLRVCFKRLDWRTLL